VTQSAGTRERLRDGAVLAAVVGAQFLAGDPASSITSGLVALIVTCSRSPRRIRSLGWLAGAYAAALLLAAAGVLPGLALLPHTVRGTLTVSEATTWSLHPWRRFELFWPHFLGNALDPAYNLAELVANSGAGELEPSWSLSLYLGAPILALAILAVPARIRRARTVARNRYARRPRAWSHHAAVLRFSRGLSARAHHPLSGEARRGRYLPALCARRCSSS